MCEVAQFPIVPQLRCYEVIDRSTGARCAAPACAERRFEITGRREYLCAKHARVGDRQIPPDPLFRMVGITVDVLFAGVSHNRTVAIAEALGQLERAIERAGGTVNLQTVRSEIGQPARQAPAGAPRGAAARV